MQMQRKFSDFKREVWVMWREMNGFTRRNLQSVSVWISAFGFLASPIAIGLGSGISRWIAVGFFVLFLLVLLRSFSIATYKVWQRDTSKLPLIEEQKRSVEEFIKLRFWKIYFDHAKKQVEIDIEWFNGTVFQIDIKRVKGHGKLKSIVLRDISENIDMSCDWGRTCLCTIHFPVEEEVAEQVNGFITQGKIVNIGLTLNWIANVEGREMPLKLQGPKEVVSTAIAER